MGFLRQRYHIFQKFESLSVVLVCIQIKAKLVAYEMQSHKFPQRRVAYILCIYYIHERKVQSREKSAAYKSLIGIIFGRAALLRRDDRHGQRGAGRERPTLVLARIVIIQKNFLHLDISRDALSKYTMRGGSRVTYVRRGNYLAMTFFSLA